ncbi:hypothetical protein AX17_000173 [Amanita inopinata Kibby_2008]|nr:hypothetical protein AX17_000173 [Amanita inopinata Kibby_2008]
MGRILRYEPARAFRALLISYRTPVQVLIPSDVNGQGSRRQTVVLDLPYAIRMWRMKDNKHFNVIYNAEAVDVENRLTTCSDPDPNNHLFMHPLAFDEEAIRTIASYFGPLEYFERLGVDEEADGHNFMNSHDIGQLYPFPHNNPRSPSMDTGCWEIKWKHRDDCIGALMTLRRIPHLTVTWAHQPSQNVPSRFASHDLRLRNVSSECISYAGQASTCIATNSTSSTPSPSHEELDPSYVRSIHQKDPFRCNAEQEEESSRKVGGAKLDWSDEDFSTLANVRENEGIEWAAWEKDDLDKLADRTDVTMYIEDNIDTLSTPGLGLSPVTPKSLGSGFPSTPTDLSGELSGLSLDSKPSKESACVNVNVLQEKTIDPTTLFVSGLELFGPTAWDEEKVRKCFGRYGYLENVKFVRPYNSYSAFAFVKFKDTQGPVRAIQEEHNRVYEGRAIRVQLRECYASRGICRPLRGRGRHTTPQSALNKRQEFGGGGQDDRVCPQHPMNTSADSTSPVPVQHNISFGDLAPSSGNQTTRVSEDDVLQGDMEIRYSTNDCVRTLPVVEPANGQEYENSLLQTEESNDVGPNPTLPANSHAFSSHPLAYTQPSFRYYPAPWFHPYMQYQFPYYTGYPAYTVPAQISRPMAAPPETDTSAAGGMQAAWHPQTNPYGCYVPYPVAQVPRTQSSEALPPTTNQGAGPHAGLFHGDQGPVALMQQPDGMEQYVSGSQVAGTASVSQSQHSLTNATGWSHYPFQAYHYPIPGPPGVNAGVFPHVIPGPGWAPSQPSLCPAPQVNQLVQGGPSAIPTDRGGALGGPMNSRRQSTRSDQQTGLTNGRGYQGRSFVGRNVRGTMQLNLHRNNRHFQLPKSNPNPTDWN